MVVEVNEDSSSEDFFCDEDLIRCRQEVVRSVSDIVAEELARSGFFGHKFGVDLSVTAEDNRKVGTMLVCEESEVDPDDVSVGD